MTRSRLPLALYFISGATSLVYEVVWSRMLGLSFGTSAVAVSTILASFMAGLALGSWACEAIAPKVRRPFVGYGVLELLVGLAAIGVPVVLGRVRDLAWMPSLIVAGFVLVFPAAAMGATFPLICRTFAGDSRRMGYAYAINTAGAVFGTLATAYLLLPALGMQRSNFVAAIGSRAVGLRALAAATFAGRPTAGNVAISGLHESESGPPVPLFAPAAAPRSPERHASPPACYPVEAPATAPELPRPRRLLLFLGFVSGFLGLLYEVSYTRVLSLILGSSIYAFSTMLATFLLGIAAGGAVASRLARGLPTKPGASAPGVAPSAPAFDRRALGAAFALTSGATFASLFLLTELPYLFVLLFRWVGNAPALQAIPSAVTLFMPAFGLGATFTVLLAGVAGARRGPGRLYALNTCGAIAGSLVGALVLVPIVGVVESLAGGASVGLLVAAAVLHPVYGARASLILAACSILCIPLRPTWLPSVMSTGSYSYPVQKLRSDFSRSDFYAQFAPKHVRLLGYYTGLTSFVTVECFPGANTLYLKNNGKVDASVPSDLELPSDADMSTQVSLAAFPLAAHPRPRDVCVIGLGGGVTVGTACCFPVCRVDVVEIEAKVVEAVRAGFFDHANGRPLRDARVQVHVEDARRFLHSLRDTAYDVIVSQPSEPWLTGVANLFTREFFELGSESLRPDGLFCQWVQLYGIDRLSFRTLLGTFRAAFPNAAVLRPRGVQQILLIGSKAPLAIDPARVVGAVSLPDVQRMLGLAGLTHPYDLLGELVAGPEDVAAFAAGAPLNTDDNCLIELAVPRTRYVPAAEAQAIYDELTGAARGLRRLLAADRATIVKVADAAERAGNLAAAEILRIAAVEEYAEAVALDPDDREARDALIRLRLQLGP